MFNSASVGGKRRREIQEALAPRLVSEPLKGEIGRDLAALKAASEAAQPPLELPSYQVIIEINLNSSGGRVGGSRAILAILHDILGADSEPALSRNKSDSTHPYIFAVLNAPQIEELVRRDGRAARVRDAEQIRVQSGLSENQQDDESGLSALQATISASKTTADDAPSKTPETFAKPAARRTLRSIFRVWESQTVHPLTTESVRTVKANAAHNAFAAFGDNIVWAILDSGIDQTHDHFKLHDNLTLAAPLANCSKSFLVDETKYPWNKDPFGHGTHVAGIIAGECFPNTSPQAAIASTDEAGDGEFHLQSLDAIKGMAPRTRLLVLRVLDDDGDGDEIALIQAIEYIQKLNDFGRHIVVHGVNISAGFPAHPTWYACGQTPLCTEINLLVNCGVVVVVAAGNSGHILTALDSVNYTEAGQMLSINDPGNAELAITVGSTHRQSPHTFGVSYFSSKGPTSDGRKKPEVVAPGERIISCASADKSATANLKGLTDPAAASPDQTTQTAAAEDKPTPKYTYIEDTGTSMAAPHVSGVLSAFLSAKREFIGQPEKTKALLMQSAMDLGRDPNLQGAGMVDLMKMIQSV